MGALERRPNATSVAVIHPDTIGRRPSAAAAASKIQIDVSPFHRTATTTSLRRGPSALVKTRSSLSDRSLSSQATLAEDDVVRKAVNKLSLTEMELAPLSSSISTADSSEDVTALRSKLEMLELKLEEMTLKVHMLQWHSDAQRQSTVEDWALERMIAIHSYGNPQQKGSISDLVRVFAASKAKTCLTSGEFTHLRTINRVRDVAIQDFLLIPSWFSQNVERDVREIARFVVRCKDSESRKRNWRLYQFATGRSPKADAKRP